jgi:hypothetical protein
MATKEFGVPQADGGGSYQPSAPVNLTTAGSLVLKLGVIDVPYANEAQAGKIPQAKKGKANKPLKPKTASGTQTTGDVAEILEEKYHIMDTFAFARLPDIAKELEDSIAGELETLLMGGRSNPNPFAKAESAIGTMFKTFLETADIEHMGIEGVPTQAALDGVNHRLKHPYSKENTRRPSFMDTHAYHDHFICWFESK